MSDEPPLEIISRGPHVRYPTPGEMVEAQAEIARLRALVQRAQLCIPEFYSEWHKDAREALPSRKPD